jgi:hypothetical protein
MSIKPRIQRWIPLVALAALLLASLACGTPANSSTQSSPDNQGQNDSPIVTEPSSTPAPPATPTPLPIGFSRNNPLPRTNLVTSPNWEVQVIEVRRGEQAWLDIQAANMFNEPAPAGMEYLLVKIHAKSTYADSEEHSISNCDFSVTGDRLIEYRCGSANAVPPEPVLDARLFTGGETEGWAAFLIGQGETNLMLAFEEMFSFDPNATQYIALDDGASISVSPDLAGIQPINSGQDRNAPASKSETVVTEDWRFAILEVYRGDQAWTMIQQANQFNEPPLAGFEFIAVKIHVSYIGTEDKSATIDSSFFKSTGSAGILHDLPYAVSPSPQLDSSLYPGGETEGWIVVQAAQGETNMILVFEPLFEFGSQNKRFISLEL